MSTNKITIITVVYNGESLIERTIKSVITQSFNSIEYIIVDGLSTDNTLYKLAPYKSQISQIVSEKDNGIYDAMNKGLKLATGEYILFLNAGDEFFSTNTLTTIFNTTQTADVYYGNTAITAPNGHILGDRRLTPPEKLNWKSLKHGMCVSHQSFIAKRELCTPYDTTNKISADYDWVINVLKKSKNIVNTHIYISKFLVGGASNKNQKQGLKERFKIMIKHYGLIQTLYSHVFILLRYPIHKLTKKSMT
ncbi:MAG: glycosyltransferase family 2 protein [Bacteroidia bacterium]